jgi:hypothetical protein
VKPDEGLILFISTKVKEVTNKKEIEMHGRHQVKLVPILISSLKEGDYSYGIVALFTKKTCY